MGFGISSLTNLAKIKKDVKRKRISSYNTRGTNHDSIIINSKTKYELCNIQGSGIIRHIWITCAVADSELYYLERLAVIPESRNKGFGKSLVDYTFHEAKMLGCKRMSIGIIAKEYELKNWYSKIGFKEGITKSFDHLPFEVTFMECDII